MKIEYLTWLQEKTGKHEDNITLPANVKNISDLMQYLEKNNPECEGIFKNKHVIYTAVNNEVKPHNYPVTESDNISFFSAIVGG